MIPINTYPTEGSTNENVLFASLGAFWTQVFADKAALKGLTFANAEEIFQSYYDLIEAIDSYSASRISVFKKVKWLPLILKKSQLNSNVLKFGEGAVFADPVNYVFGAVKPQGDNIYVVELPDNLRELSVITNRVISPDFVLVNNVDVRVSGEYLYFYGNPFSLKNISTFNILDTNGNQVYYTNPLTGQLIPDQGVVLWIYNGKINTDALNYNIAYLFGVNLPNTEQSKDILAATVKLFSGGPSVHQLKAICGAFLGVKPVLETQEEVTDIFETNTQTIVTTDKHVYKYDNYYKITSGVQIGSKLAAGDIPVDAVEFYDNVIFRDWWLNKMVPKVVADLSAESGVTPTSPAITLPPHMFLGTYQYGLTFKNEMELITRADDGTINFPVDGYFDDVCKFQQRINQNQDLIAKAVTEDPNQVLLPGTAMLINPLDFLFRTVFRNNTAMLKVNFKTQSQLQLFTQYFSVIKKCLPKHIYMLFMCDFTVSNDVYTTGTIYDTSSGETSLYFFGDVYYGSGPAEPGDRTKQLPHPDTNDYNIMPGQLPVSMHNPLKGEETIVCMNTLHDDSPDFLASNQHAVCQELVSIRPIPNNVSTRDFNTLDLTAINY